MIPRGLKTKDAREGEEARRMQRAVEPDFRKRRGVAEVKRVLHIAERVTVSKCAQEEKVIGLEPL